MRRNLGNWEGNPGKVSRSVPQAKGNFGGPKFLREGEMWVPQQMEKLQYEDIMVINHYIAWFSQ